ncbi:alpha/beta hydrolase [Streptomyces yaizuensis]|uniref:Alpha/beta hydrolase n=1 Tax=Streptomyces yaizuensis TaxID=2989713 RepID=A0ABQ5P2H0_9ACTN|nr:alpha/beta hydrolase family protein [Streptomyces sp. YSPA8]GLF96697.1 alpha/beta hydrolase [Streptomyces sp. YSPA8]
MSRPASPKPSVPAGSPAPVPAAGADRRRRPPGRPPSGPPVRAGGGALSRPPHSAGVRRIALDAGGPTLSALLAEADGPPRATILALHGGGMTAAYFDGQAHPGLSLLTLGAALGYTVLAVDRPGYGSSAAALPDGATLAEQAATLRRALDDHAGRSPLGAGVFVVAHSYGGKLALTAAARGLHDDLVGIDISGCGHRYAAPPPNGGPPAFGGHGGPRLNWGPLTLYPPQTFALAGSVVAPMPLREAAEAARWERTFPTVAAGVRVPVRLTFAEHEGWWRHDPEALEELSGLLSADRLLIDRQPAAGHNISLGWAARAYHLRALGFLEECLQARVSGPAARTP